MRSDPERVVDEYWERVWNESDLDALEDVLADSHVRHSAGGTMARDRSQVRADMAQYFRVLTKARVTIDDRAVSGDTVWTRLTLQGLNLETEQASVFSWLHVARVEDGRIVEAWHLSAPGVNWNDATDRR